MTNKGSHESSFETYVEAALRTASQWEPEMQLVQGGLGMNGELQEILDAPPDDLADEIGDAWWYVALAADALRTLGADGLPKPSLEPSDHSTALRAARTFAEEVESAVFQREGVTPERESRLRELLRAYTSGLTSMCDTPPHAIWRQNVEKLSARHPDGFEPRTDG